MPIVNLTAEDTCTIFDRVFNDLADADAVTIAYANDSVNVKTGKNGNTIFAKNETGRNATVVLRVMRGSSDDRFLQGKLATQNRDFVSATPANGEFVKRLGDGTGLVVRDVYTLLGGMFQRNIDGKENVEGDTEQGVAVYNMIFAEVKRSQQ